MKGLLLGCLLLLSSCGGPRYVDFFPYHDNGCKKPEVVLMPVRVPEACPQELSTDLMADLRLQLMDHGQLYLYDQSEVEAVLPKDKEIDFYNKDLSWTKRYQCADFVTVVEAIEHRPYNYPCGCNMPYYVIKLRLKVIDVRGECPRVILYELLESCQRICPPTTVSETHPPLPGSYKLLCDKVVDRLERVIRSVY